MATMKDDRPATQDARIAVLVGLMMLFAATMFSATALAANRDRGRFVGTVEAVEDGQLRLQLDPSVELNAGDKLLIGKSLTSQPHGQVTVAGTSLIMTTATANGIEAVPGYILWLPPASGETAEPNGAATRVEAQQPAPAKRGSRPIDQLERLIGKPIDFDTHGGNEYRKVELLGVRRKDDAAQTIRSIQILDSESGDERSISFIAIARMGYGGRGFYESEPRDRGERSDEDDEADMDEEADEAADQRPERPQRRKNKPEITEEQWLEIAAARNVTRWPELTEEEHQKTIDEHREMMAEVSEAFPGMQPYETEHYLILSNIPPQQLRPYITQLDIMHTTLVDMFELPEDARVWRGKALVLAFINEQQFFQFEGRFMNHTPGPGTYGLCHQRGDGTVIMACYRGDNSADFGQMLIHEMSHGFVHRFLSAERLPAWLNEGLAEWIGEKLVPASKQVDFKIASARKRLQETRTLQGMLDAPRPENWHYGAGAHMTDFLIKLDAQRFAVLIRLIKGGMGFEEALGQTYGGTASQFVATYGRSIGIPDLRP